MNLNQVTIPSTDVERSKSFYQTLGLNLIVEALPRYLRFECPEGESTLSIHLVENMVENTGTTIYFEVEEIEKVVNKLKEKGLKFNTEITDQPWLWTEADLYDPDGNRIVIFNAGNNRKNPPWRI